MRLVPIHVGLRDGLQSENLGYHVKMANQFISSKKCLLGVPVMFWSTNLSYYKSVTIIIIAVGMGYFRNCYGEKRTLTDIFTCMFCFLLFQKGHEEE